MIAHFTGFISVITAFGDSVPVITEFTQFMVDDPIPTTL